jgi:DNA-binding NarL/FixJ family response regulator
MKTPPPNKEKLLILIVDDNMCFVERMISLLDELDNVGYINVATDYDEASRMVSAERPDLVLLDINLPGKNGIQLLKQIRKNGNDCKVIMITNHADDFYRQQCRELGADHFLDKSNDFGKVPSIIRRWGAEWNLSPTETNA